MSFWASRVVRGDGAITVQHRRDCSWPLANGELLRRLVPPPFAHAIRLQQLTSSSGDESYSLKTCFALSFFFPFPVMRNGNSLLQNQLYSIINFPFSQQYALLYGIVLFILLLDCHASLSLSLGIVSLLTESYTIHPSSFRRHTYLYSTQLCRA